MTTGALLEISVRTMIEAEEAVADLMERMFGQVPTLYTDERTLVTRVSVFLNRESSWTAARKIKLRAGLQRIRGEGLAVGPTRIRIRRLASQDWAESWKRHFHPLEIARTLLVKPTWSKRQPRRGQALVVIDPGLSFGTSQHPTTRFCLEQLVACRQLAPKASLLDIGTGSGILAIAAAKLGYGPIEAFDFDPLAVRVAGENLERNGVSGLVRLYCRDLRRLRHRPVRQFSVVSANLLDDLLIAERDRILARVRAGGYLILAGILARQFRAVESAYESACCRLLETKTVRDWQSGTFVVAEPVVSDGGS